MNKKTGIFISSGRKIWPHEMRVAGILASNGHYIEFLEETNIHTADILLDGIEFEIKSPKTTSSNSLEHILKKGLKQSPNLIIDTSRMKGVHDERMKNFLAKQVQSRKQIKKLILVTKKGEVIDIFELI